MVLRALPDSYAGREQAFIKHSLLKGYLEKLFLIVGSGKRAIEICYVDCFAGPWGDESESMDGTSIAISLKTLDSCRRALASRGVQIKMRALFVEKEQRAFARLERYLASSTPAGIDAQGRHGDFVELRGEILNWAGPEAFVFFFVDPKGWTEVGIQTLRPLLNRPRSELLINFMYNFVNRTMSIAALQTEMSELVGERIVLAGIASDQREDLILSTYRKNLKACMPTPSIKYPPRSAYARVLHSTHERTWYHLVYLTTHPKGIIEFMSTSETVDVVQKQVRATSKEAKREEQTRIVDMFAQGDTIDVRVGCASEEDVDAFWVTYLRAGERRIGLSEFAIILEDTNWFPADLQASLVRLTQRGVIQNLDSDSTRPKKPLHYETGDGERLVLAY